MQVEAVFCAALTVTAQCAMRSAFVQKANCSVPNWSSADDNPTVPAYSVLPRMDLAFVARVKGALKLPAARSNT